MQTIIEKDTFKTIQKKRFMNRSLQVSTDLRAQARAALNNQRIGAAHLDRDDLVQFDTNA